MLFCLSIFFLFISVFYLSNLNFNVQSLFTLSLILFILVVVFSYYFTLNQGLLLFDFLNISIFSLFSTFNYVFSFIVLLICVVLLGFMLSYFKWFYFFLWFVLAFFFFFFSITFYIISFNFILLFLFWESMGVCWFFLISSFFFRNKTRFASFVAFFWNLSGDFALLIYFIISLILFWSLSFTYNYFFYVSCCFLVFSIFAKSAVYPLHTWLYYAMEGPTPVSAFLHAAWMITAGVYLFFVFPFFINSFLFIFSLFSIIFFSINAIFYFDLKKIIASWTGSQMGYIFLFFSLGFVLNGLLLFWYHAVFKSYFFFLAGFIISSRYDYQDLRSQTVSFIWFFFLLFCWAGLVGLFYFWTGTIKEIFVYNYLGIVFIKFSFFFIFIFWFIYSFKLYIIKYSHSLSNNFPVISFLFMSLVLLINWFYTTLMWNCEHPLFFFGLYFVITIAFNSIFLFMLRFDYFPMFVDFYNYLIFNILLHVFLRFLDLFYDFYIFCNFFFTFY